MRDRARISLALFLLLAAPLVAGETYDVKLEVLYGGQPIRQALVTLTIDGAVVADDDSDDSGWVSFTGLAVERFEVLAKKPGYFDRRAIWYNFTRKDIESSVPLKKRVKWALSGSVRGRGPGGVALIPGAKVSLLEGGDAPAVATTAADGTFVFRELYDTECRFRAEAAGWHSYTLWSANRTQKDLHFDLCLRAGGAKPEELHARGEREAVLVLERKRMLPLVATADRVVPALSFHFHVRLASDGAGPAGGVERARILCPDGRPPAGVLARADRVLKARVRPFPRGVRSSVGVPRDGGTTGWGRKARRGR